jgi:hypothetical protein
MAVRHPHHPLLRTLNVQLTDGTGVNSRDAAYHVNRQHHYLPSAPRIGNGTILSTLARKATARDRLLPRLSQNLLTRRVIPKTEIVTAKAMDTRGAVAITAVMGTMAVVMGTAGTMMAIDDSVPTFLAWLRFALMDWMRAQCQPCRLTTSALIH